MPRATCRCGQVLSVPKNGPERVICPRCSARIRVRRDALGEGDGFIRFDCPCGRRLKIRAGLVDDSLQSVQCPDCGRIVAVPGSTSGSSGGDLRLKDQDPESPTVNLDEDDLALLDRWTSKHLGASAPPPAPRVEKPPAAPAPEPAAVAPPVKAEAGLRICPRCGRPLHLSAVACRNCGAPAPRR